MARKHSQRDTQDDSFTLDLDSDDPEVLHAAIKLLQQDHVRVRLALRSAEKRAQRAEQKAAKLDRALTSGNTIEIKTTTTSGALVPNQPLQFIDAHIDANGTITDVMTTQGLFVNIDTKHEIDAIIDLMGIESRRVYMALHYDKTKRDFILEQALEGNSDERRSRFMSLHDANKDYLFRTYGEIPPVLDQLDQMMQWVVNHEDACRAALEGDLGPLKTLSISDQLGIFAAENRKLLSIKTRGADRREYVQWAGERVGQFVQAGRQLSDIDEKFVAQLERDARAELSQDDFKGVQTLTERRYKEGASGMPYVRRRLGEWMQSWENSGN